MMRLNPVVASALLVGTVICGLAFAPAPAHVKPHHEPAATVFVNRPDGGHGAGVHMGSGVVLTAAHVVEGVNSVRIVDEDGHGFPASILWSNRAYDVALVRTENPVRLKSAPITCKAPPVGSTIEVVGAPLDLGMVHTFGHVASVPKQRADWRSAYVADVTGAPGNSGGPVFDARGEIAGILVAGYSGFMLELIVDPAAICDLLARKSA